ncbi:HEAT repeat domain-containing protein [Limnoglobus roseus]|uniref:HEAT repeat domain-containing protein n=1 Tax=Limnoglobus roseus TaxID=2598579 RepID=A0A5C1ANU5_9BACT|nr:HEAT repeat domain-containing protein [Limnoglobus roseus]QEL20255.1 HEAT repeat domain-containing protein [Limnoglobus roseus]
MTTADESLAALIADTQHFSPSVRLSAFRSLSKLGVVANQALPDLTNALNDEDAKIREGAAQAIGQLGREAMPTMVRMLTHPDKYVRRNAVWGLGKLGPQAKAVMGELCQALKDEDPRTAAGAAQAIGSMGAEAAPAVPQLAEAMRGTNIVLCRLAAKALSQIGRPSLATLISHLKHHDPFVKGEAAVALGWMGPAAAAAVQPLTELLRGSQMRKASPSQYASGLLGCGTPTTPVAPPSPVAADNQTEEGTRINAVTALGRIGPDAMTALPYLQDALTDASDSVRRAAEVAIRQVQGVE